MNQQSTYTPVTKRKVQEKKMKKEIKKRTRQAWDSNLQRSYTFMSRSNTVTKY